ncbi:hypothetical protein FRC00_007962 [Tulasnella sp. 408]|nr:hypothetical protein FRC00_007962 [Tulasnella sp. 408]
MGKDWHDPAEMAKDSAGVATWDVLRTLPFDLSIITGKRKWRWPMILYFANRIFMLIHIFAYCVNLNAIQPLRTIAVWHRIKRVWVPLAGLGVVQVVLWGLTMQYSKSVWNSQRRVCQIMSTSPVPLLIAVWSFTMTLDFIIMVLCSVRLWRVKGRGGISSLLLRDGIAYFFITFIVNFVQTVLAALSLNPIMNIIVLPMTLVVSVIASTTVFRNVFILHDDFASESERTGKPSTNQPTATVSRITFGKGSNRPPRFGGRRDFLTTNGTDTFAMETVRSSPNLGGVEVTRTVDIERDGDAQYNGDLKADVDDGTSSVATRDEKGRAF